MLVLSKVAFVRRCSLNRMMLFCPVTHRVHYRLRHILLVLNMALSPPAMCVLIRSLLLQSSRQVVGGWESLLFNNFRLLRHMLLHWCEIMRCVLMVYNFVISVRVRVRPVRINRVLVIDKMVSLS